MVRGQWRRHLWQRQFQLPGVAGAQGGLAGALAAAGMEMGAVAIVSLVLFLEMVMMCRDGDWLQDSNGVGVGVEGDGRARREGEEYVVESLVEKEAR